MLGRNMAMKVSLAVFFGGLLWGTQVVSYHLNELLPPDQSVHAIYIEKISERHYVLRILGEAVDVKLPRKEELMSEVKECIQIIPVVVDNIQGLDFEELNVQGFKKECLENLYAVRNQGLN